MDEKTVDRIFAGALEDLPPVSSKIVRIFTSSTFTDMLMERNTLMEYVYPKIREYCREKHGLEFQVRYCYIKYCKVYNILLHGFEIGYFTSFLFILKYRLWTCVGA